VELWKLLCELPKSHHLLHTKYYDKKSRKKKQEDRKIQIRPQISKTIAKREIKNAI